MKSYKYEEMTPSTFLRSLCALPVFFIPLGLLEWHAEHLPLGLDGLKAQELCLKIAQNIGGGIVLPPIYHSRPGFSTYIGTLTYSEPLVTLLLTETMHQLKKVGAKVIVIITGHYGPLQVDCVKRTAENFAKENPEISVIAQAEYEGVYVDGISPADHAGIFETSIFMALMPRLVKMENFEKTPKNIKIYDAPLHDYYKEDASWVFSNEVEKSSTELGERTIAAIVQYFTDKISELLPLKN